MTNVYSLDGILVFGLLFVCTCAYFKKVPRLKTWLLSEKKGVWGVFYKGKAVLLKRRLHLLCSGALRGETGWAGGCCDWNPAACCCGNRLCRNGLLRLVYKMNSKESTSPAANQGDEGEEPVGGLHPA
ncbi:protein kish-B isoform X1 [Ochotona curzoniae]|uniref:protein kish-B isoform X1 n=1 Tax=Ochotona curzoniae TaxID=130825 RepID=UPI001B34E763|nr:protein kish-B isoform X1 [Ochotona curzoniae]